jgi:hypothetical protein
VSTLFCIGDVVLCKITFDGKLARSVSIEFDRTYPFYIICLYEKVQQAGYLLLVPRDIYLAKSWTLTPKDCKELELLPKFIGSDVVFAVDKHITSIQHRMTGLCCDKCNIFCEYSEVNRLDKDGKGIYVCWSCRSYPQYK